MNNDDNGDPIEVLLREHSAAEAPPDLRAQVLQRLQRGDAHAAADALRRATASPRRPAHLLTAAMVLLGIAVVVATRWLQRTDAANEASTTMPSPPELQDPQPELGPASFELQVVDLHGGPVQTFVVDIVRANDLPARSLGKLPGFSPRHLVPRDFRGDFTTLGGLPTGRFVAIVTADAHARTCSAPFELTADAPPRVTVKLEVGGEVRGVVKGAQGKPLAGARVRTAAPPPKGFARNSGIEALFAQMRVDVLTSSEVLTDDKGEFRLRHLALGNYDLLVEHRDHCEHVQSNVAVVSGSLEVPDVQLRRGARVRGRALDGDQGVAGVEITLSRGDADEPGAATAIVWKATSDVDGNYELPHRLPPGRYRIRGMVPGSSDDPFAKLTAMQRSERTVEVVEGADLVTQDVTVGKAAPVGKDEAVREQVREAPVAAPTSTWTDVAQTTRSGNNVIISRKDADRIRDQSDDFLEQITVDTYSGRSGPTGLIVKAIDARLASFGVTAGEVLLEINGKKVESKAQAVSAAKSDYNRGVRTFTTKWLSNRQVIERIFQSPPDK